MELLATLRRRGLTVTADGDALIVRPRELLTDELRAAIRAHKPAILAELTAANDARLDTPSDPGAERRCTRALALLEANPNWRRAVIAEAGDPAVIGIAIRDVAYGELEVAADCYDPGLLLALLDQYGRSTH